MSRRLRQVEKDFPGLGTDYHKHSRCDIGYNCIAFAAGDMNHWWQPGMHWPSTSGTLIEHLVSA
jgi:hypothetical protein